MNPTAVFLMLEGPQVLRREAVYTLSGSPSQTVMGTVIRRETSKRESHDKRLTARASGLTPDAMWLLLEGPRVSVAPPFHRAA
jgi:hypothetical protein